MITSFFKPKNNKADRSPENSAPNAATSKRDREEELKGAQQKKPKAEVSSLPGSSDDKSLNPEVKQLLSHLHSDSGWRTSMDKYLSGSSFKRLAAFVEKERKSQTIFPPAEDTFSCLNLTPLDQVKVVIVGQDPYHGPGQAHGLCFSVRKGIQVPPSLRNIYKELVEDPKIENFQTKPNHGFLERWAKQGVLMINTCLTVRKGDANSHAKKGWEEFTDQVIRCVARREKGVVFLLWGKPASTKAQAVIGSSSKKHVIISTSHPSPLGATKTNAPFTGSRCFSKCNDALLKMGHAEVDWQVDGPL